MHNTRRKVLLLFTGVLVAPVSILVQAQDGFPDLDYGEDGLAHTYICAYCTCDRYIKFDPQGRVVLGGGKQETPFPSEVYATRYTLDGRVDSTYGENGVAYGLFCTSNDLVYDMVIGADGSVFVCGREDFGYQTEGQAAVLKWDPNGQLDTTFGQGLGTYYLALGDQAYFYGMALQEDGKLVLGGYYDPNSYSLSNPVYAMLHRINADGTPDTTFGVGSLVVPEPPGSTQWFGKLAIQPDGRILAALQYTNHTELRRYMPDGTLDASFATDGVYPLGTTGSIRNAGIFLQEDGRITCFVGLGAGFVDNISYHRIVRLMPDGTPDPASYGGDGQLDLITTETSGLRATMLPDGRLLIPSGPANDGGIRCLANDGTWDMDFGTNGLALPAVAGISSVGAIAIGPDQRFAAATGVESDVWYAQHPDVAALMYHADSLWNLSTAIPMQQPASQTGHLKLYPSPVTAGQLVTVEHPNAALVECIAVDGRYVSSTSFTRGASRVQLPTDDLPAGIYSVRASDAQGHVFAHTRLVVQ